MKNVRWLWRVWRRRGALSSSRWKLNNSWFFLECNPCVHYGRQTRKQRPFLLLLLQKETIRCICGISTPLRSHKLYGCLSAVLTGHPQHTHTHTREHMESWAAVASRWAPRLMDNVQPCNKHKCVFCLSFERHPPPGPGYEYSRHYSPSAVPTKVPLIA